MSVFSVFNIGSGHDRTETNNTIGNLYLSCAPPHRHINDGPNTMAKGMDKGVNDAMQAITLARPSKVNMAGHSRGAVMCHMIANEIARNPRLRHIEVNIVALDPVNMSRAGDKATKLSAGVSLGKYVALVMENVNGMAAHTFPPTAVATADAAFETRMKFMPMPGTHGSGTQCHSSAIGRAAHATMMRCMAKWGTTFTVPLPSPFAVCNHYAEIHVKNLTRFDKKGLIAKRLISTDAKKQMATSDNDPNVNFAWQSVGSGRVKALAANYERMVAARNGPKAPVDYRNTPYFFNEFHAACFRKAFPAMRARIWKYDFSPATQDAINIEIARIERLFPYIRQSMEGLGMI